ncbi:MAG: iron uptake transporter permease EfeU [Ardenticatenales bacterium]
MLPAFVIGLREGVEAALIVGMIAAFLRRHERADALRWVVIGVVLAGSLCLAAGVALHALERSLPPQQQEGFETVLGLLAVVAVTYMVLWMRRHARTLKASIEVSAGLALAQGSALALVLMAFLAVLREGLETAIFLVAAFQNSANPRLTGTGALLGLVVAVGFGYAIFAGGVRIDLARFFRVTGVVLVLVAAGLVASAIHTAHEAGWVSVLQRPAADLRWLVRPGSVSSALITGMFGIQPRPTQAEALGWLVFVVPVLPFVLWPGRRAHRPSNATRNGPTPAPPVAIP